MTQGDIEKAFINRWRIKSAEPRLMALNIEVFDLVKRLCYDFFEAGILLGKKDNDESIPEEEIAGFEQWWKIYDKKRGKERCIAKWRKLSYTDKKACLCATPAYVASTPDKVFRKDPLTYLNGKCWNDEIIQHNGTQQPTIEQQRLHKLAGILTD